MTLIETYICRIPFILFWGFLLFSVDQSDSSQALTNSHLKSLEELLQNNNLDVSSEFLQNFSTLEWPSIVSVGYKSNLSTEEIDRQKGYRELASILVKKIEIFEKELRQAPSDTFLASCHHMILLRNHIVRNPSYVNMLLADTINRVLYVNLAMRIVKEDANLSSLEEVIKLLAVYPITMNDLMEIGEKELGKLIPLNTSFKTHFKNDEAVLYLSLWSALDENENNRTLVPPNIKSIGIYDVLVSQELSLLMWRYVDSDLYIKLALPLTIEYRKKTHEFSIDDNYQKIKLVLGEEWNEKRSFSSYVVGRRMSLGLVADLLGDVKTKRIQRSLLFSLEWVQELLEEALKKGAPLK